MISSYTLYVGEWMRNFLNNTMSETYNLDHAHKHHDAPQEVGQVSGFIHLYVNLKLQRDWFSKHLESSCFSQNK